MIGVADWGCAIDGGDGRRGCGGMVDCGWDAVVEKRGKRLGCYALVSGKLKACCVNASFIIRACLNSLVAYLSLLLLLHPGPLSDSNLTFPKSSSHNYFPLVLP